MIEQLISTIISKNIKTVNLLRFKDELKFKELLTVIVFKLRELSYDIKFITPYLLKVDRLKSIGFSKCVEVKNFNNTTSPIIIGEITSSFHPTKTTSSHNTLVQRKKKNSSLLLDRFPIADHDKSIANRRRDILRTFYQ